MVTHDPKAAEKARRMVTWRRACWSTEDGATRHVRPAARPAQRVPSQAAHHAHVVGIVVAIAAFGLLRTIVDAWYAGANASSSARLVTRNSISLAFPLPLTYAQRIRQVPGVASVSWANWFGGVYISERNFFPQFAIDPETYLDMYPEYVLPPEQRKAFLVDREGCYRRTQARGHSTAGRSATRSRCAGRSFPGTWTFNLRGIYDGVDKGTDKTTVLLPLVAAQRDDQEALSAPRRPDRRVRRAARAIPTRRRRCPQRSTPPSRIRSRRRSPRPRRRSSSASSR